MLKKWVTQYELLKIRPIKKRKPSDLSRPVYYLSSKGIRMLAKYKIDFLPLEYLNFNAHNEQCNEVTIQTLFKLTFDVDLINNPTQQPLDSDWNHLTTSSTFDLNSLDLRPWSQQVPDYKKYSFVPDQIISFVQNKHRCEIMIELDNRSEGNLVQLEKIYNYMLYAHQNPNKRILMSIAIADGALPNFKLKNQRSIHKKINCLLNKFKNSTTTVNRQKYSLATIYQKIGNLLITIAGVGEAHIDLADFIANKNFISSSINMSKGLANSLTKKLNKKVFFQSNRELKSTNLDYFSAQGRTLGYMIYNSKPLIYQPVYFGYEHTLDTYLDILNRIPQNCIYAFPARSRRLLTPANTDYYRKQPGHSYFSYTQGMLYQPILENNINPNVLLQLIFIKHRYPNYLYRFFTTKAISASDKTDYSNLTYLSSSAYPPINRYLQKFQITLQDTSPRDYLTLQKLAKSSTSPQEFAKKLNVKDIPLEVLHSIFRHIPIRAFSSPYKPTSSTDHFIATKYLYLPDAANPTKRTKISFLL